MGRAADLDRLLAIADAVERDGREVVLIAGEAGIGKSRLVQELLQRTNGRFRVMVGRCMEFGEEIWPFAALRELLASLIDQVDKEALELVLGGSGSLLRHLIPELGEASVPTAAINSARLCEAVIGMLRRLGQWGPMIVVIEDLHWADASTRALFSLLSRSGRPRSMMLIGTYRIDEVVTAHPLSAVLEGVERCARPEHVDLERLCDQDATELLTAIAGETIPRTPAGEIFRLSGGNPFFIEELTAAHLAGLSTLPQSLRNVLLARTATLAETARGVLAMIAVAGRTSAVVLAMALAIESPMLEDSLGELQTRGLVVCEGGEIRLRHELARNVFLAELSTTVRCSAHAALARSLTALRPDRLGEIAKHWAEAGDAGRALIASVGAGRRAMTDGTPSEALGYYEHALRLWEQTDAAETLLGTDVATVLVDAAEAAYHAHHLDRAIELAKTAVAELDGRDPWREGKIWLRLRAMYRFSVRWDDCAAALARAIDVIPESPPSPARVEALADAALGHCYAGRAADARRCADEAMSVAGLLADRDSEILARYSLGAAMWFTEPVDVVIEHQAATVAMCGPDESPERTILAYNGLTNALVRAGRLAELIDVAAAGVALVRRTGLGGPLGPAMAEYWVGCLVTLGRWVEAEAVSDELGELIAQAHERDVSIYMARALTRQGRLTEARPAMSQLQSLLRQSDYWAEDLGDRAAALIEFDTVGVRSLEMVEFVDELLVRGEQHLPCGEWVLVAAAIASLADRAEAVDVTDARRVAELVGVADRWLAFASSRGEPDGDEEALERDRAFAELSRLKGVPDPSAWANIASGHAERSAPYEEAYARWRGAQAILSGVAGRSSPARRAAGVLLKRARALATRLPAPPLLDEIDALARCARLELADSTTRELRAVGRDSLGLTKRERAVLQLVANGMSNGQIGQELFISRKTASVHVSNILRKLQVHNRVEAAAVIHRLERPDGELLLR